MIISYITTIASSAAVSSSLSSLSSLHHISRSISISISSITETSSSVWVIDVVTATSFILGFFSFLFSLLVLFVVLVFPPLSYHKSSWHIFWTTFLFHIEPTQSQHPTQFPAVTQTVWAHSCKDIPMIPNKWNLNRTSSKWRRFNYVLNLYFSVSLPPKPDPL